MTLFESPAKVGGYPPLRHISNNSNIITQNNRFGNRFLKHRKIFFIYSINFNRFTRYSTNNYAKITICFSLAFELFPFWKHFLSKKSYPIGVGNCDYSSPLSLKISTKFVNPYSDNFSFWNFALLFLGEIITVLP